MRVQWVNKRVQVGIPRARGVYVVALAAALAQLGGCTVRTVHIKSQPEKATVLVDGVEQGVTPLQTKLVWRREEDTHRITLRAEEHEPVDLILSQQSAAQNKDPWVFFVNLQRLAHTVAIQVESQPPGAQVRVNEKSCGTTPCQISVSFNRPTSRAPWSTVAVEVAKSDYETVRRVLDYDDVVARGANKLHFNLEPLVEEVSALIESVPSGARIYVDGQHVGASPTTVRLRYVRPTAQAPWGQVGIKLELEDHQSVTTALTYQQAQQGRLNFELPRLRKAVTVNMSGPNADGAEVFVNNERVGTIPYAHEFVFTRRSAHDRWSTFLVVVRKEGYRWRRPDGSPPGDTNPFSTQLTLEDAERGDLQVPMEPIRYVWTRLRQWSFVGREPGISETRVLSQTVDIETEPSVRSVKRVTNMRPGEFLPTRLSVTPPPNQDLVFAESFRVPGSDAPRSNLRRRVGEEALQRLTDGPAVDIEPAVSPDGRFVYFASNRLRPDRLTLWRVELGRQSGFTKITDSPSSAVDTEPAIAPDGRIAFTSYLLGSETPQIWVAAADGSSATQIRVGKQPAWSPDGTLLAFVAPDSAGYDQIWTMAPDGREPVQMTHGNHTRAWPSWTPDKRIVYVSDQVVNEEGLPNKDIWIMNLDGSGQTRLTQNGSYDSHPVVTPDGRYVYFISNRGARAENEDNWQIWRIELPGGASAP